MYDVFVPFLGDFFSIGMHTEINGTFESKFSSPFLGTFFQF